MGYLSGRKSGTGAGNILTRSASRATGTTIRSSTGQVFRGGQQIKTGSSQGASTISYSSGGRSSSQGGSSSTQIQKPTVFYSTTLKKSFTNEQARNKAETQFKAEQARKAFESQRKQEALKAKREELKRISVKEKFSAKEIAEQSASLGGIVKQLRDTNQLDIKPIQKQPKQTPLGRELEILEGRINTAADSIEKQAGVLRVRGDPVSQIGLFGAGAVKNVAGLGQLGVGGARFFEKDAPTGFVETQKAIGGGVESAGRFLFETSPEEKFVVGSALVGGAIKQVKERPAETAGSLAADLVTFKALGSVGGAAKTKMLSKFGTGIKIPKIVGKPLSMAVSKSDDATRVIRTSTIKSGLSKIRVVDDIIIKPKKTVKTILKSKSSKLKKLGINKVSELSDDVLKGRVTVKTTSVGDLVVTKQRKSITLKLGSKQRKTILDSIQKTSKDLPGLEVFEFKGTRKASRIGLRERITGLTKKKDVFDIDKFGKDIGRKGKITKVEGFSASVNIPSRSTSQGFGAFKRFPKQAKQKFLGKGTKTKKGFVDSAFGEPRVTESLFKTADVFDDKVVVSPVLKSRIETFGLGKTELSKISVRGTKKFSSGKFVDEFIVQLQDKTIKAKGFVKTKTKGFKPKPKTQELNKLKGVKETKLVRKADDILLLPEFSGNIGFVAPKVSDTVLANVLTRLGRTPVSIPKTGVVTQATKTGLKTFTKGGASATKTIVSNLNKTRTGTGSLLLQKQTQRIFSETKSLIKPRTKSKTKTVLETKPKTKKSLKTGLSEKTSSGVGVGVIGAYGSAGSSVASAARVFSPTRQKESIKPLVSEKVGTGLGEATGSRVSEGVAEAEAFGVASITVPKFKEKEKTLQKTRTGFVFPRTTQSKTGFRGFGLSFDEPKTKQGVKKKGMLAYDVFVRRSVPKGKSKIRGTLVSSGLPKNRALKKGLTTVDKYSDRTVIIKQKGTTKQKDIPKPKKLLQKFRRPRSKKLQSKGRNVFVEKSRYAIDSITEKQGITYKGILSSKTNKRRK